MIPAESKPVKSTPSERRARIMQSIQKTGGNRPLAYCGLYLMLGMVGTAEARSPLVSVTLLIAVILVGLWENGIRRPDDERRAQHLKAEALALLSECDPSDLALLLDLSAMSTAPYWCTAAAHDALLKTVSQIGPKTQLDLTPMQCENLRLLIVGSDPKLAIDVLSAFQWIGDHNDLGTVQRVASGAVQVRSPEVRERAQQVLPLLEARLRQQHVSAELLRASSAPDGDTLLRAHTTPTEEHAETLLRPVE